MFNSLVTHLEPLLESYGALGVFCSSIIEEIIAPIPSTLVVFTASVLLTHGKTVSEAMLAIVFSVMLPASAGITIGSLFPYFLARIGEKVAIERFGKFLGINWASVEKLQAWSKTTSSDQWIVFLTRAMPGVPSLAISVTAGLVRMPLLEYIIWSFLGTLIRTFLLGCLGAWGGAQVLFLIRMIGSTENVVLISIVVLGIAGTGIVAYRMRRRLRKV